MNAPNDQKRTIRNIIIFSVVTLSCGWLGYWLDKQMSNPPGQSLGQLLWLIAPLVTALLLRAFAGDGWKDFGLRPAFKGNAFWYGASVLIYPLIGAVVLAIGTAMGLVSFPNFSVNVLLMAVFAGLLPAFIKNIFEEFAWRGYLAPKVRSLGINDYLQHVIVGVIWGCWHIPYLLFMFDRTQLETATAQSITTLLPLAMLNIIAASIAYGEIRAASASVWTAVLMHTIGNSLTEILIPQGFVNVSAGLGWLVSPAHQSILTMLIFLAVGVWLHKRRTAQEASQSLAL